MEDESHIIRQGQQGDLDSCNRLVELYQGQVYNLAFRMLGDRDLAADAAQQTFISAYRAIRGFRGGDFRSWLPRIVANACRDMLRAAKARRSISLEALALTPAKTPISREESPEEYAMRQELGTELRKGLDALSHDHRLVLVLVDIQGFSYEDAARLMRTSVGTIKSRLSRARAQMRDYLRQRPDLLHGNPSS